MGRIRKITLIAISVLLLISMFSILTYQYAVLEPAGDRYLTAVRAAADKLRPTYAALAKSTEGPLFLGTAPENTKPEYSAEAARYQKLISDARRELKEFSNKADSFSPMPHVPLPSSYTASVSLYSLRKGYVASIETTLNDYEQLITYLEKYYSIRGSLDKRLAKFNALDDLDVLAGTGGAQISTAEEIRANAQELEALRPPALLEGFHRATLATHYEAATAFDNLAAGLMIPSEAAVYAAAAEIETVTSKHETSDSALLVKELERSSVLKNVSDLPEKLERYQ